MDKHVSIETAIAMHQQGQLDQAEAMYKQILQTEPQHFDALQLLATITLQRNNYEAAIDLFDRALKINPNFADAHNNRGTALKNLKYYQEALDSFDLALKINPEFAIAHFNRGNSLCDLKRYEEALDSYNCALSLKPYYIDALKNRGNLLQDLNRHQEALESHERAIKLEEISLKATAKKTIIIKSNSYDAHNIILALESCSRSDIYWSNEYFYRWLSANEPAWKKSTKHFAPEEIRVLAENIIFENIIFIVHQGDTLLNTKLDFLNKLVIEGKFPGAAVALARYLSKNGEYGQALEIANSATVVGRKGSHIIQNQITAIERQIEGKPIHAALLRYIGDDNDYLLNRTCEFLFERIDIHENGNAAVTGCLGIA